MMTKRTKREHVIGEAKQLGRDFIGVDEWKRSKLGYLTGFSAFTTAGKRVFKPAAALGAATWQAGKRAFGREEVVRLPTEASDPSDRFLVAREVYGATDAILRNRCRATHNMALAMFLTFLALLVYGIICYADIRGNLPPGLGHVFPFYLTFPVACLFLRASFHNYQIRHEALHSFGRFLRSGELLAISPKLNRDREVH